MSKLHQKLWVWCLREWLGSHTSPAHLGAKPLHRLHLAALILLSLDRGGWRLCSQTVKWKGTLPYAAARQLPAWVTLAAAAVAHAGLCCLRKGLVQRS